MTDGWSPPKPDIRGYSALDRPATRASRVLARLIDLSFIGTFLALFAHFFGYWRGILLWSAAVSTFLTLIAAWAARRYFHATLGELCWRLRKPAGSKIIKQQEHLSLAKKILAMSLTLILCGTSAILSYEWVTRNPLVVTADNEDLEAYAPPLEDSRWSVLPFFYSLGPWPKSFQDNPVLYSLPFEKGPPIQFVGKIIARWANSDRIRVTIEGPLTPPGLQNAKQAEICFKNPISAPLYCLAIRQDALIRHLDEMQKSGLSHFSLHWFQVNNAAMFPDERPRGIHLTANSDYTVQERYLLVNSHGAIQAIILDHPSGPSGESSRQLLEQVIRAQRISPDLTAGRVWVDRAIQDVQLDKLGEIRDSKEFVARLSEVHGLLLAAVSVDPHNYDAFYHLGGTGYLLAKHAKAQKNTDLTAVAKPLVQNSLKFARDVLPLEKRNQALENLWLEIKDD